MNLFSSHVEASRPTQPVSHRTTEALRERQSETSLQVEQEGSQVDGRRRQRSGKLCRFGTWFRGALALHRIRIV